MASPGSEKHSATGATPPTWWSGRIDLAETIQVDAYEIPDRLRDQIRLRDGTCVFPHCTRTADHCDLDHVQALDRGGTTEVTKT